MLFSAKYPNAVIMLVITCATTIQKSGNVCYSNNSLKPQSSTYHRDKLNVKVTGITPVRPYIDKRQKLGLFKGDQMMIMQEDVKFQNLCRQYSQVDCRGLEL